MYTLNNHLKFAPHFYNTAIATRFLCVKPTANFSLHVIRRQYNVLRVN